MTTTSDSGNPYEASPAPGRFNQSPQNVAGHWGIVLTNVGTLGIVLPGFVVECLGGVFRNGALLAGVHWLADLPPVIPVVLLVLGFLASCLGLFFRPRRLAACGVLSSCAGLLCLTRWLMIHGIL